MKLILVKCCILAVCTSFSAFSQTSHSQIIEAYGQERYQTLLNTNPGMIELLEAYVDHGVKLIDMNDKYLDRVPVNNIHLRSKSSESITVEEFIELFETEEFNPLNYSFFPNDSLQVFVLGATNKVLIIESQKNLLN